MYISHNLFQLLFSVQCTTTIGILDGTEDDTAVSMCENNKGTIGNNSCNGFMACSKSLLTLLPHNVCFDS